MSRMKTLFKYFLLVIICYFGSNSLIYATINNSYHNVAIYQENNSSEIDINLLEAKATTINGYVKGKIKNNCKKTITKKYIIIDLYSENKIKMGTKLLEVTDLKAGETIDFETNYKYSNVSYCIISSTDNMI